MKQNNESKQTIECPYCGTEYMPSEIYDPKYFLGQEKNIERDFQGKILYYEGVDCSRDETFICEKCDKQFSVHAEVKFTCSEDDNNNVHHAYVTQKPVKLFLDES